MAYKINVLLDCHHVNLRVIEDQTFIPRINDKTTCDRCKKQSTIIAKGSPAKIKETEEKKGVM